MIQYALFTPTGQTVTTNSGTSSIGTSVAYNVAGTANDGTIIDYNSTSTYIYNPPKYSSVELINTIVLEDGIELIYKGFLHFLMPISNRIEIWKDIYGCFDGKFCKIETVYGRHIPAQEETYEFD